MSQNIIALTEVENTIRMDVQGIFKLIRLKKTEAFLDKLDELDIAITGTDNMSLLQQAIARKNVEISRALIEKEINVNHQEDDGSTALHYLADHPNVEIAKMILAKGGDVNLKDKHGNNALWAALARHAGTEIIKLYKDAGADIHSINNVGKSPLDKVKDKDPEHEIYKLFAGDMK